MKTSLRRALAATAAAGTLLAGALNLASPASAESNGGVRIMPLGDSITDGITVSGAYRTSLWQRLTGAGAKVDFVGSLYGGPSGLGDHDHEGHSGWRIDQIDANISTYLRNTQPRTVLLHIGTNDMNQNYQVSSAPQRLSTLIDHIYAAVPNVHLFVATIIPASWTQQENFSKTYNAQIPGIVQAKANAGRNIHLVDMHSALTTADLADGVHPNANGYTKMAAAWWTALQQDPSSYRDGTTTTTTTTTRPTTTTTSSRPPTTTTTTGGGGNAGAGALVTPGGKCLGVSGTANASSAQIQTCNGGSGQSWSFASDGTLRTLGGSMCLDASGRGTANGTALIIYACHGDANQRFSQGANSSIVNAGSGRCVDVPNGSTADGTGVQLYDCWGGDPQKWTLSGGTNPTTTTSTTTTRSTTTTTTTTRDLVTTTTVPQTTTTTTTTSGGSGGPSCSAAFTLTGSWGGGFQGDVKVTNTGGNVTSWTVTMNLNSGQSITSIWSGVASGSTGTVRVANAAYNGNLGTGASTSFGFTGGGNGTPVPTVSCTANGS
jgi:lysophospholipase L1-like esterase